MSKTFVYSSTVEKVSKRLKGTKGDKAHEDYQGVDQPSAVGKEVGSETTSFVLAKKRKSRL